ncbi:class I SAM-dependent methyltransferase [Nocardiopsis sp. HNM0947]|uniref:Class I SAM-dependent methyltransferase n=1 Tax=Nocardiopsis coralli TaxID=2772213 RepID=A0ABR9P6R7_9ACTN|nr:class I SAM-dependent methyltransferase [Nocardiopsis coralli]MBE2999532.1 class I SAM-dependent methyltransferase [Nocardiopsis coralli]
MTSTYIHDSGSDLGKGQLDHLSVLLDEHSRAFTGQVGPKEGDRCLDLGSGNGSMARWMAQRSGLGGQVHALDLDTTHLDVPSEVRVHRHDLTEGLGAEALGGPFDLIHARLLLLHLRNRRELLAELTEALAPGGWLVLGEFTLLPFVPLEAPSDADAELYQRILRTNFERIAIPAGQDYTWAGELEAAMAEEGLGGIETMEYRRTARGGSPVCRLLGIYLQQLTPPLRAMGTPPEEIERVHELLEDARLRVGFFPFVGVRGQKPA